MRTSPTGRAAITGREGKRLRAYRDSTGVWTIGVGHTGRMAGPPVTPGMTITQAQCDALLAADLAPVERALAAAVAVPVSQNEFDAMASLGFNIGAGGLARSSVVRRLNAGDVPGAAAAFMLWDKPPELRGRRDAERRQFLTPDAVDAPPVAAARAATLAAKAAVARGRATATGAAGAASIAAAAASVAAHGHIALAIGGVFALGALVDGAASLLHARRAATLAANASRQIPAPPAAAPAAP